MPRVLRGASARLVGGLLAAILVATGAAVVSVPAHAEDQVDVVSTSSGAITGTVSDESGERVADVGVTAVAVDAPDSEGSSPSWAGVTDENGDYSLSGLPAGDFKVEFTTDGTAGLIGEWWDDAPDFDSASAILLTDGELRTDVDAVLAAAIPPVVQSAVPTVVGTLIVGETLTAVPGSWTDGATFTYQWLVDGAAVLDANQATFLIAPAYAGKSIAVSVTGSLDGFSPFTQPSASTPKVATAGTPRVTGIARVGATLTAVPGTWTASTVFAYQWLADGDAITGATKSSFVPTSAQDSKAITVRVTGMKSRYATVAKTSAPTLKVMRFSKPVVSGSPGVGFVLAAKPGAWSADTTFTYQWFANGVAIKNATKSTFTPASTQRDKQIAVKVTGGKAGTTSVAVTSAPTARVAAASTPSISGTVVVGGTLAVKPGTWTAGTTFSYRWYANGSAISGATRSTVVLTSAQRDTQITVTVTGKKSGYGTLAKTSAKSLRVALTAAPSISGFLVVGSTLSARTGTWTPGTAFTYQWFANGAAISGATHSTLKLTSSQAGKSVTVRVTGKKSGYQTISRNSAATGAVAYPSRTTPVDSWTCPSWAPIKGNASSMIYHMPGQSFYTRTKPEECFSTEGAAQAAGYRKAKV
ncbi:carboxypeptidase regulatory-like domain-containing protein [Microbacterium pumilum]